MCASKSREATRRLIGRNARDGICDPSKENPKPRAHPAPAAYAHLTPQATISPCQARGFLEGQSVLYSLSKIGYVSVKKEQSPTYGLHLRRQPHQPFGGPLYPGSAAFTRVCFSPELRLGLQPGKAGFRMLCFSHPLLRASFSRLDQSTSGNGLQHGGPYQAVHAHVLSKAKSAGLRQIPPAWYLGQCVYPVPQAALHLLFRHAFLQWPSARSRRTYRELFRPGERLTYTPSIILERLPDRTTAVTTRPTHTSKRRQLVLAGDRPTRVNPSHKFCNRNASWRYLAQHSGFASPLPVRGPMESGLRSG